MESVNYIAQISGNIDALGTAFTTATYGALAAQMSPILAGFFVLYLIFWGFQYWQGLGETNLPRFVFRLFRVAIIFSLATGWGAIQTMSYDLIRQAPTQISSVLLNNIINVGHGAMSTGTVDRDLYDFFAIASSVLEPKNATGASQTPGAQTTIPTAQRTDASGRVIENTADNKDGGDALGLIPLVTFLAAAAFIGSALAIIIFAKLSLWICLSLAPVFIALLMFRAPSRFFGGWANVLVQAVVIPIFLYAFLAFYFIGIKDVVIALGSEIAQDGVLSIGRAAPFVLVSLCGLFLVAQILPLARHLSSSTQAIIANAAAAGGTAAQRILSNPRSAHIVAGSTATPRLSDLGSNLPSSVNAQDSFQRELQARQNAARSQRKNL